MDSWKPVLLGDKDRLIFAYRSSRATSIQRGETELAEAIHALLQYELRSEAMYWSCKDGPRGDHLMCIMGHHRQSMTVCYIYIYIHLGELTDRLKQKPRLTAWHHKNMFLAETFREQPIIKQIT
jgi:hypothetical protein